MKVLLSQHNCRCPPSHDAFPLELLAIADLGFYVAVDGALRLPRNLPAGAIITFSPPGSFYQVWWWWWQWQWLWLWGMQGMQLTMLDAAGLNICDPHCRTQQLGQVQYACLTTAHKAARVPLCSTGHPPQAYSTVIVHHNRFNTSLHDGLYALHCPGKH